MFKMNFLIWFVLESAHRQEKEEIDKELDEIHEFVENECKSGGADMSKTQRRTLKMMASVLGIECHLKKRSKNHHGKKHHGNDRDNDNDKEDEQKKLEELDS